MRLIPCFVEKIKGNCSNYVFRILEKHLFLKHLNMFLKYHVGAVDVAQLAEGLPKMPQILSSSVG